MNSYNEGDWVWMQSKEDVVIAAQVQQSFLPGQQGRVRLDSGEVSHRPTLRLRLPRLSTSLLAARAPPSCCRSKQWTLIKPVRSSG